MFSSRISLSWGEQVIACTEFSMDPGTRPGLALTGFGDGQRMRLLNSSAYDYLQCKVRCVKDLE